MQTSSRLGAALATAGLFSGFALRKKVRVSGHLWIYASKFPPNWDSTPVLEQVFSDFKYAGIGGVELMEVNLRHDDAVKRLRELMDKYRIPVTGTSYNGQMWNKDQHSKIFDDASMVIDRLSQLGGVNLGITVGNARRKKSEEELDAQGDLIRKIIEVCRSKNVVANIHNHTFELDYDMHDLKGTLARVPELKLGPDLSWLIRGGVDPAEFIRTYGKKIVYMHIRDQGPDGKWTEYVGQGVTDFSTIAKAIKEVKFEGEVAIELASDTPPVNPMKENWKMSREYVKKVFGW